MTNSTRGIYSAMYDSLSLGGNQDVVSQCDCCGEMKDDCTDTSTGGYYPVDVHACGQCRLERLAPPEQPRKQGGSK
jgi:hypothetical protein